MKGNPKQSKARSKPEKPSPEFPLFAHGCGQWARKINKKLYYFGVWEDPDGALAKHDREYPYLKDGRRPPLEEVAPDTDGCTLRELCNAFLRFKEQMTATGELSGRSLRDYFKTCEGLIKYFGKERRVDDLRSDDFQRLRHSLSKRLGLTSLSNEITRIRVVFKYAYDEKLIKTPVSYGQSFDRPSITSLRKEQVAAGPKLFRRDDLLAVINAADVQLKAMVLLGINCGFGNTDCAKLPMSAIDLKNGWVDYPRVKTGVARRVPLWPETIKALQEALAVRPSPSDATAKHLCFLTRQGRPWVRLMRAKKPEDNEKAPDTEVPIDAVSQQFSKLMRKAGITARRGISFYTLRHCFETYGGESKDQVAVNAIMGHVDKTMAAHYRHDISDERLRAVTECVRQWLFGTSKETPDKAKPKAQRKKPNTKTKNASEQPTEEQPRLKLFVG